MADFEKAYRRTMRIEAGWCNTEGDSGGETFAGVARNYHGNWHGWRIIDATKPRCKDIKTLNQALFMNKELMNMVHEFYKEEFWNVDQLDKFDSQLIAENVFDAIVNCGLGHGIDFLQKAINKINPIYKLVVDNKLGNKTFSAMNDTISKLGEQTVVDAYVDMRIIYHQNIASKYPSKRKFLNSWLYRCKIMRRAV
ncbi:MAG: glycosyl hydrolase 108 family protein [Bacteroidota bacterium]|nr:glycosyl hydrolase 108 family protein [Bacteroidota bacterium]